MGDFAGIPDNFTIPVPWRCTFCGWVQRWLMALDRWEHGGEIMGNQKVYININGIRTASCFQEKHSQFPCFAAVQPTAAAFKIVDKDVLQRRWRLLQSAWLSVSSSKPLPSEHWFAAQAWLKVCMDLEKGLPRACGQLCKRRLRPNGATLQRRML